jgi:hypothetical protein
MKVRRSGDHWSKGPFRDRDWTGQTNTVFSDEEPTLPCNQGIAALNPALTSRPRCRWATA